MYNRHISQIILTGGWGGKCGLVYAHGKCVPIILMASLLFYENYDIL